MNAELFIRYVIEFAVFIPAGIMSVIPVHGFRKVKTGYFAVIFTVMMITAVLGGAAVCSVYHLSSNILLLFFCRYFFLPTISVMTFL